MKKKLNHIRAHKQTTTFIFFMRLFKKTNLSCNPKKGTHAPSQSSRPIPLAITRYNQNQSINFLQSGSTRNLHFFTISFFSFNTITYLKNKKKGLHLLHFFFFQKKPIHREPPERIHSLLFLFLYGIERKHHQFM